jgi:segregation and condensation protein B
MSEEENGVLPGEDSDARPGLEKAAPVAVGREHLKSVVESLIFVSDKPLPTLRIARIAHARKAEIEPLIAELAEEYRGRGIELVDVAGGWQFRSTAANAPFVRELVARRPVRLTRAQVEALAIIGYRQPVTRPEIDEIRGVDSGSALKVLLERGLVRILGRKDEPGRPLLYGTTTFFLEFFGLPSISDLPTLKEYTELSEESRALFARKTGEHIEEIADIAVETKTYTDEELEAVAATAQAEEAAAAAEERAVSDVPSAESDGE